MRRSRANKIPPRLTIARCLIRLWPLDRGRGRLVQRLLRTFTDWPDEASFTFRYGRFLDTPVVAWPRGYRDLFTTGIMDINEVRMWKRVLRAGDAVVDGGANYGYWSLVASRLVGKPGRVFAFEPMPTTFAALSRNLSASSADNVVARQLGLADHAGRAHLTAVPDDPISGGASLGNREDCVGIKKCVDCELVRLDDVVLDSGVRLIKLDIEGSELPALRGGLRILQRAENPVLTFEWNRAMASGLGYQPEAIRDFLRPFGYEQFLATARGLVPFREPDNAAGWTPMVWGLTDVHQRELAG